MLNRENLDREGELCSADAVVVLIGREEADNRCSYRLRSAHR